MGMNGRSGIYGSYPSLERVGFKTEASSQSQARHIEYGCDEAIGSEQCSPLPTFIPIIRKEELNGKRT